MPTQSIYRVGGHCFALAYPNELLSEKELIPYAPFQTDSCFGEDRLFTLSIIDDAKDTVSEGQAIADLEDDNGRMTLFKNEDGSLTINLSTASCNECGSIHISGDYRRAKAWIGGTPGEKRYALDTALMLLYTFASSKHHTLLLHASAVEHDDAGYLFLGKSGTGKSTHSSLWQEHITGSELLNDDNPIIRIVDEKVYVYGSPWSGKTRCYRNIKVLAGGIIRLRQAPSNRISHLTGLRAYAAILPSCACMKWDHDMSEAIHSTISKVIGCVPVYGLECLPDKAAAVVCHTKITTNKLAGTRGTCVHHREGNHA